MTTHVNSKKKGSRFERTVAKILTGWTGYEFSRTPASGGLRWQDSKDIVSDVVCTDKKHSKKFQFAVECKSYKEIRFEHTLLDTKSCKINSFWEQARRDSERAKKLPMLIMKYNGMAKGEAFVVLDNFAAVAIMNHTKMKEVFEKPQMAIRVNQDLTYYIFMLSDVLKLDYQEVFEAIKPIIKQRYPKNA